MLFVTIHNHNYDKANDKPRPSGGGEKVSSSTTIIIELSSLSLKKLDKIIQYIQTKDVVEILRKLSS